MDCNQNNVNVSLLSINIKSITSKRFHNYAKRKRLHLQNGQLSDTISAKKIYDHKHDCDTKCNIDCGIWNLEQSPTRDINNRNEANSSTQRSHNQNNKQQISEFNESNRCSDNIKDVFKHVKAEEEDADKQQKENSKCSGSNTIALNPNAPEWDKPAQGQNESGVKMKTIPETRPFKESNSTFFDAVGPSKILISRKLTEEIVPARVLESFYNIYHFMNKSLVFQCIKLMKHDICVINYGFHDKNTGKTLYCIAAKLHEPNDTKYKWQMLKELFTAHQIQEQYNIAHDLLPHAITSSPQYEAQMARFKTLTVEMLHDILRKNKWQNIPIHTKRNYKERKSLFLSHTEFKKRIEQISNSQFVPIVRINHKAQYWFEHVLIVPLQQNMTIGISLQYDVIKNKIKVTGIHLNEAYLHKSHQLLSSHHSSCVCLDSFESFYDDLIIGNMDLTHLRKEILRLQTENEKIKNVDTEQRPTNYYKTKYLQFKQFMQKVVNISSDPLLVTEAIKLLQTTTTPLMDEGIAAKIDTDEKCSQVYAALQTEAAQPQIKETLKPPHIEPLSFPVTYLGEPRSLPNIPLASVEENKTAIAHSISPNLLPIYSTSYAMNTMPLSYSNTSLSSIPIYPPTIYSPIYNYTTCTFGITPPQMYHLRNTSVNLSQMTHIMVSTSDSSLNLKHPLNKAAQCTPFSPMHGANSVLIDKLLTERYVSDNQHNCKTMFKNDPKRLYYYLKQSIKMQIMDGFARKYDDVLAIAHCDLYSNASGELLYVIMEAIDALKWKMVSLSTYNTILSRYSLNIIAEQMPPSSRNADAFKKCVQLNEKQRVMRKIAQSIPYIKFRNKRAVKSKSRSNCKKAKQIVTVTEKYIKKYITRCVNNNVLPIPIVKIKDNKHWIEWLIICKAPQKHMHFGISFRCTANEVDATSIFLDGTEIERQNKLIGAMHSHSQDLSQFVSAISKLVINC